MNNDIIAMIQSNFSELKHDINTRFDKLEDKIEKMVNKEDCKNNRNVCSNITQQKLSIKKIGVISGIIGVVATNLIMIFKILSGG